MHVYLRMCVRLENHTSNPNNLNIKIQTCCIVWLLHYSVSGKSSEASLGMLLTENILCIILFLVLNEVRDFKTVLNTGALNFTSK